MAERFLRSALSGFSRLKQNMKESSETLVTEFSRNVVILSIYEWKLASIGLIWLIIKMMQEFWFSLTLTAYNKTTELHYLNSEFIYPSTVPRHHNACSVWN